LYSTHSAQCPTSIAAVLHPSTTPSQSLIQLPQQTIGRICMYNNQFYQFYQFYLLISNELQSLADFAGLCVCTQPTVCCFLYHSTAYVCSTQWVVWGCWRWLWHPSLRCCCWLYHSTAYICIIKWVVWGCWRWQWHPSLRCCCFLYHSTAYICLTEWVVWGCWRWQWHLIVRCCCWLYHSTAYICLK
jgi:hypothetical protein